MSFMDEFNKKKKNDGDQEQVILPNTSKKIVQSNITKKQSAKKPKVQPKIIDTEPIDLSEFDELDDSEDVPTKQEAKIHAKLLLQALGYYIWDTSHHVRRENAEVLCRYFGIEPSTITRTIDENRSRRAAMRRNSVEE